MKEDWDESIENDDVAAVGRAESEIERLRFGV